MKAMTSKAIFHPRGDKQELELGDRLAPKFDADGLIPCITVDAATNEVLMFAFMNEFALSRTIETGHATYWSRSRGKLWIKGEESGNVQTVKAVLIDCDLDTIVLKIEQIGGAACHTGHRSCFYRERDGGTWKTVGKPLFDPAAVYKK